MEVTNEVKQVRSFLETLPKDSLVRSHLLLSLSELESTIQDSIKAEHLGNETEQQSLESANSPNLINPSTLFQTVQPRGPGDIILLMIHSIIRNNGFIATTVEEVKGNVIPGFAPPIRTKDLNENEIVPQNWKINDNNDGHCTFSYRDANGSYTLKSLKKSDSVLGIEFGNKKKMHKLDLESFESYIPTQAIGMDSSTNFESNGLSDKVFELIHCVVPTDKCPVGVRSGLSSVSSAPLSSSQHFPQTQSAPQLPSSLRDPNFLGGGYRGIPHPSSYGGVNDGRKMGDFGDDILPPGFGGGINPGNLMGPNHPSFGMGGGLGGLSGGGGQYQPHFPQPRYDPLTPFPHQGQRNPNDDDRLSATRYEGEPNPDHLRPPTMNDDDEVALQQPQQPPKGNKNGKNPASDMYL